MSPSAPLGWRGAVATILVVAALARMVFAGWVVGLGTPPKADEADYHAIAVNLVDGRGFAGADGGATARRPPAYPVLLAGLYTVAGPSPAAGRLLQVLLGTAVVALTIIVARRWFDSATALVAGGFAAVNPFLVFISGYLLTENLYLVLVLGAVSILPSPRALAGMSWRQCVAFAGLLGAATLVRPTGLPVLEWMLAGALLFAAGAWRVRLARVVVVAIVVAAVLAPWYLRNRAVVGGAVLTTHGGITFYQGNNARVVEIPHWRGGVAPLEALPRFDELVTMDELARDRLSWQLGRDYLRTHPGDVPELVAWKLARFWRLRSDMGLSGIRSGWWFGKDTALGRVAAEVDVGLAYAAVAMPLFVAGVVLTRRRWRDLVFAYGLVVVHTAVAAVFFGSLRGRLPVEPMICVFAGVAACALVRAVRRRAPASLSPARSGRARSET